MAHKQEDNHGSRLLRRRKRSGVSAGAQGPAPMALKTPLRFGVITVFARPGETGAAEDAEFHVMLTGSTPPRTFEIGETRWQVDVDEATSRALRNRPLVLVLLESAGVGAAMAAVSRENDMSTVTVTVSVGSGATAESIVERLRIRDLDEVVECQQNVAKVEAVARRERLARQARQTLQARQAQADGTPPPE